MKRHRILFAIPELAAGGPDRVFSQFIHGLDRSRFAPMVAVSRRGGRYFDTLPSDVGIHLLQDRRYPVRSFASTVEEIRPDLIFTTLRMNVTASLASYLQSCRPPLVIRQANAIAADFSVLKQNSILKHRVAEIVVRRLMRRPAAVVVQSRDMETEVRRDLRPTQTIAVIGNPISVRDVEAMARSQPVGRPFGAPALISVGRLAEQKGYDLLLPAFASVLEKWPEAGLTLFGEGPERGRLTGIVNALGIGDHVRLPGQTDAPLAEMAQADLFVSSSRYEGFSNAILEAMAVGTAVVATDCPGATREMIIEGETGFLAPAGEIGSLCEAIQRALSADRSIVTAGAHDHVQLHYGSKQSLKKLEHLFETLIASPGR